MHGSRIQGFPLTIANLGPAAQGTEAVGPDLGAVVATSFGLIQNNRGGRVWRNGDVGATRSIDATRRHGPGI